MKKSALLTCCLVLILLAGCAADQPQAPTATSTPAPPSPPTQQDQLLAHRDLDDHLTTYQSAPNLDAYIYSHACSHPHAIAHPHPA